MFIFNNNIYHVHWHSFHCFVYVYIYIAILFTFELLLYSVYSISIFRFIAASQRNGSRIFTSAGIIWKQRDLFTCFVVLNFWVSYHLQGISTRMNFFFLLYVYIRFSTIKNILFNLCCLNGEAIVTKLRRHCSYHLFCIHGGAQNRIKASVTFTLNSVARFYPVYPGFFWKYYCV